MGYEVKEIGKFKFIEEGDGPVLVLLHGLFGALSNWDGVVEFFKPKYKVLIPVLPIYDLPLHSSSIDGLVSYLTEFIKSKNLKDVTLLGNSLGGHIGLVYTLKYQELVKALVLTGSSGLFENSMGGSFPKRGSYEFVKEKVEYTFYDPKTATPELVQEVFETTKNIPRCLRIVSIAKSAQRHNLSKELGKIKIPTLLVWGLNDTITPPMVAHEFNRLIPNSRLRFIDKCCHAPMMEHPDIFNQLVEQFLNEEVFKLEETTAYAPPR